MKNENVISVEIRKFCGILPLIGILVGSATSYAQMGDRGGNGGDPLELRMENIKVELRNWILATEFKDLNLGGQDPKTLANFVLKSIDQASVSLTDRALFVGVKERACINFPQTQAIECNRAKLKTESDENLYPLMLHEYMGLAGLEQNLGEESDYKYSRQARDFVEYKLAVKLGAIRRSSGLASMKFVALPGGRTMLSWSKVVTLSPFEIQTTEVTQAQYVAVTGSNPSYFQLKEHCPFDHQVVNGVAMCPNHPVEQVSWNAASEFATRLTEMAHDGYRYRLPTSAEWEYAGRGGKDTDFYFGNEQPLDYAWFDSNSGNRTHAVGGKRPNAFGLCDMHGNVREWVQNWFYLYEVDRSGDVNPMGPSKGKEKILRGGAWSEGIENASFKYWSPHYSPDKSVSWVGFRLVRTPGGACCSGR